MKRTKLLQRNQILFLFTLPILLMYCLFFIVPLLMGMKNSFTDWSGTSPDYNFIGIGNYIGIFGDERFRNALWFNFKYTFLLTAATMVISLVLALILNQKIKARGLFRSIYFLPAVLSLVTVGLIWNELFYRMIPAIGEATGWGLFQSSWLGSPKLAMYAILIVNLWQGCATPIVLLIAGLQSVPEDLYEAASIDGATAWDKFRAITIPYLIPVLNMVFVTCVKGGLTTFILYIPEFPSGGFNFENRPKVFRLQKSHYPSAAKSCKQPGREAEDHLGSVQRGGICK